MRAKKARRLRKEAEDLTIGYPAYFTKSIYKHLKKLIKRGLWN